VKAARWPWWVENESGECMTCGREFGTVREASAHARKTGHFVSAEKVLQRVWNGEDKQPEAPTNG
jgi:hypothetical protein